MVGEVRAAKAQAERVGWPPRRRPACAGRRSRRCTRHAAMSEPCPPAFMRTAPPIEPGHPDRPFEAGQPGCGSAPRQHRQGDGRTGDAHRVPVISMPSAHSARLSATPANPASATNRFDPRPTTKHRKVVPGDHLGDAAQVVHRRRADEDGRRAPDSIGRHRAERLVDTSQWTEIRDRAAAGAGRGSIGRHLELAP